MARSAELPDDMLDGLISGAIPRRTSGVTIESRRRQPSKPCSSWNCPRSRNGAPTKNGPFTITTTTRMRLQRPRFRQSAILRSQPRNNQPRTGRVLIARGRDAADVPLSNIFGAATLAGFRVWTDEVPDSVCVV